MKKITKVFALAIIAIMLCSMFSFSVFAAVDPIVIDFSKYDYSTDVLDSDTGGDGEFNMVSDGDKRVLMAECVNGYDPAADPDGTGTTGDLYTTITDFAGLNVNADTYQWIKFGLKNASAAPGFEVHFATADKGLSVSTSITFDIDPNSDYKSYVFNVTDQCKKYYPKRAADVSPDDPNVYPDYWHGLIEQFRLDFMYYEESGGHAKTGDKLYIEYIAFFDTKEAADAWTYTPAKTAAQYDAEKATTAAPTTTLAPTSAAQVTATAQTTANAADAGTASDTTANGTTSSGASSSSGSNAILWIIIAAAAVIVIIIIVILVTKKKK